MLPALGHCEDVQCQSTSTESVRLFRCSIHCDRNLCLFHLNAHNVYYEEEKKENQQIIHELQNQLNVYQTIFEKQIVAYRELVHQASTILLHNTTSLVPIEQIRMILDKIQQATGHFHDEKSKTKEMKIHQKNFDCLVMIKCESMIDEDENAKKNESGQKVVVRIPRIDLNIK